MSKNINFNISHLEHYSLPRDLFKQFIAERYDFGEGEIEIEDAGKFIKSIKKKFDSKSISEFRSVEGYKYIVETEEMLLLLATYGEKSGYLDFYAKDRISFEKAHKFVYKFVQNKKEFIVARSNFYISNSLNIKEDYLTLKDFEDIIPEYFPNIDTVEFFKQYMLSDESIFVLSGKSGTGKTKFLTSMLKYILKNPKILKRKDDGVTNYEYGFGSNVIKVAYVKNESVLSSDTFWISLKEREYDFVILDDLDYFLSPRKQDISSELEVQKDKFISEILSFTDGVVKNKTKFMISTNREIDSIDEALQRSGRLFSVFSFDDLTKEEALVIWKKNKLKVKDFNKEFKNRDSLLAADLGSKIQKYLSNDGKAPKNFIKNGAKIDISDKFKKKKRTGFDV